MLRRSPLNGSEQQTQAVIRDMIDNATYGWLKLEKLTPEMEKEWLEKARVSMQKIQADAKVGQYKQFSADNIDVYYGRVFQFCGRVEAAYISHGLDAFQAAYR